LPFGPFYIHFDQIRRAAAARKDEVVQAGIVYINAPTIGAEIHLPFGGAKRTGNGHREAGNAALDFYSEWKTLYAGISVLISRMGTLYTQGPSE